MKKWKFSKSKSKKKSPEKEEEDLDEMPKEVGFYHDFLVFDKNEKYNQNLEFQDCDFDDPNIKDWLILKYSPNKTKSRFSSLFEEIMENDKKLALEEKSEKNEDNKIKKEANIINDINKKDNINIINENDKDSKQNIINNEKENKDNQIKLNINDDNENNNIIIDEDEKNTNIINNPIKINNIRNNSDSMTNILSRDSNATYNNFFKEKKMQEISFSYTNPIKMPNITPHFYEHNNSFYSSYSGPHEHKKSIYSNNSGPHEHKKSIYSFHSGPYEHKKSIYSSSSGNYATSTNESELNFSSRNSIIERNSIFEPRPPDKKLELTVDIKKVISLEDRRTTVMIKNIPNKFTRDMLLNIIDQQFKGAYDLFILPTDVNRYKNFGYSFINFNCSYYIPYFYFLFNGKKWSSTNSQKICEITYSKIQGRNNLLSHYSNKIIFRNEDSKKYNIDQKFIIPNEYRVIFNKYFPNYIVEDYNFYFITKMPFKY